MKALSLALLLTGCQSVPNTTSVRKDQDYTMPSLFTVTFQELPGDMIPALCGAGNLGCFRWMPDGRGWALVNADYYDPQYLMVHECMHPIYGMEHR